jgi:hypothetical protein
MRQGKTFRSRRWGLILFCVPGTERELEKLMSSLLCQRAEGGEETHADSLGEGQVKSQSCRQSRRGASKETVTLGINSESCNSRYHGE